MCRANHRGSRVCIYVYVHSQVSVSSNESFWEITPCRNFFAYLTPYYSSFSPWAIFRCPRGLPTVGGEWRKRLRKTKRDLTAAPQPRCKTAPVEEEAQAPVTTMMTRPAAVVTLPDSARRVPTTTARAPTVAMTLRRRSTTTEKFPDCRRDFLLLVSLIEGPVFS